MMTQFLLEFLHFVVAGLAILVTISSATLFYLTQRVERAMKTFWRSFGFAALAIAFFLFILERKYPSFELAAVLVECVGFGCIFVGVLLEPGLQHIRAVVKSRLQENREKKGKKSPQTLVFTVAVELLFIVSLLGTLIVKYEDIVEKIGFGRYIASALVLFAMIFIAGTIYLQIQRYFKERGDPQTNLVNLYPLIAYIALFVREISLILYRLPDTNIVFIENLRSFSGLPWQVSIVFGLIGFAFLGLWVWVFIKPRFGLRTYVVFLAVTTLVSAIGSFTFTLLIFNIIEINNMKLMTEGARTQHLVMEDRSNTALVLARNLAGDPRIISGVLSEEYYQILDISEKHLLSSGIDILRVYDSSGTILASSGDERERGERPDDEILGIVLDSKQAVKTFDTEEHILAPVIIARGIYPIMFGDKLAGAVEVGYKMDTAFVDYSKSRTGLDVTIYSGADRSATTIYKLDGVSRWVGTEETNEDVVENVLENGKQYSTALDRLGQNYYSAFVPVRNFEGSVIGMISVGTSTNQLFEDSRQQLLSAFLITTLISIFVALIGYFAMPSPLSVITSKFTSSSSETSSVVGRFMKSREIERKVQKIKEKKTGLGSSKKGLSKSKKKRPKSKK